MASSMSNGNITLPFNSVGATSTVGVFSGGGAAAGSVPLQIVMCRGRYPLEQFLPQEGQSFLTGACPCPRIHLFVTHAGIKQRHPGNITHKTYTYTKCCFVYIPHCFYALYFNVKIKTYNLLTIYYPNLTEKFWRGGESGVHSYFIHNSQLLQKYRVGNNNQTILMQG